MTKKFQRNIEDFICGCCDREVKGTGYTNHCPNCLWSKHVDINPGDRAAECGGMMKPTVVEGNTGKESLVHECLMCGHQKRNKLAKDDNFEEVFKIIVSRGKI